MKIGSKSPQHPCWSPIAFLHPFIPNIQFVSRGPQHKHVCLNLYLRNFDPRQGIFALIFFSISAWFPKKSIPYCPSAIKVSLLGFGFEGVGISNLETNKQYFFHSNLSPVSNYAEDFSMSLWFVPSPYVQRDIGFLVLPHLIYLPIQPPPPLRRSRIGMEQDAIASRLFYLFSLPHAFLATLSLRLSPTPPPLAAFDMLTFG